MQTIQQKGDKVTGNVMAYPINWHKHHMRIPFFSAHTTPYDTDITQCGKRRWHMRLWPTAAQTPDSDLLSIKQINSLYWHSPPLPSTTCGNHWVTLFSPVHSDLSEQIPVFATVRGYSHHHWVQGLEESSACMLAGKEQLTYIIHSLDQHLFGQWWDAGWWRLSCCLCRHSGLCTSHAQCWTSAGSRPESHPDSPLPVMASDKRYFIVALCEEHTCCVASQFTNVC